MPATAYFANEFAELFGASPLTWQCRLYDQLLAGRLPNALDLPTGLGKTSVMAIWLIALAHGARLPRRLVYVVDRRTVVDQATSVAKNIRCNLAKLLELKQALGVKGELPISTLRGQFTDNRAWQEDPSQPAIIIGTVDMVGSRLLFSGYGVSSKMRSYHAGLLGVDTLVVLDEAHLVPPFEKLLDAIETGRAAFGPQTNEISIPAFKLLSLSATGRQRPGEIFRLEDEDFDAFVRQRLAARKRLKLEHPASDLISGMAQRAWERGIGGYRVIVFCNSRKIAQEIYEWLKNDLKKNFKDEFKEDDSELNNFIQLIVGERRVHERESLTESGVFKRFQESEPHANAEANLPTFLVCTSAGEVGVDLNADHMVCDLVPWERMVQRLGRVNRTGRFERGALIDVFPIATDKDKEAEAKIDQEKLKTLAAPFESPLWEPEGDGRKDASPGRLRTLSQIVGFRVLTDAATTPAPLYPALSRPLVDAWSMTSLKEHTGRPQVAPWLRGWVDEDDPETAVVWRKYLPVREEGPFVSPKEIKDFFEAAPPHLSEILETETWRVVDWLVARAVLLTGRVRTRKTGNARGDSDAVSSPLGGSLIVFVLEQDGTPGQSFSLDDLENLKADKKARERLEKTLQCAVLIVDARFGGLSESGLLDLNQNDDVLSADSDEAWSKQTGTIISEKDEAGRRFKYRFHTSVSLEGEILKSFFIERPETVVSTNEDGKAVSQKQLYDVHIDKVVTRARALAQALELEGDFARVLEIAARLHDEGKKSMRWQRAFNAPHDGVYAKTKGPINQALLDGYRHEFGSLADVGKDPDFQSLPIDLQDLVLHIIAAHHGGARPVIETRSCDDAPPSALEERARDVALRFARLQKTWGPWGLAWWESLLRAADQQASRENDLRKEDKGAASGEAT